VFVFLTMFLTRTVSQKMFQIRTLHRFCVESLKNSVSGTFSCQNLKILKHFWNKKCSSWLGEFKSKGSAYLIEEWLTYLSCKNSLSVVIKNTVPNTNSQRKTVPNKNTPCTMHGIFFSSSKWTILEWKHENFNFVLLENFFVNQFYVKFQRFKFNQGFFYFF